MLRFGFADSHLPTHLHLRTPRLPLRVRLPPYLSCSLLHPAPILHHCTSATLPLPATTCTHAVYYLWDLAWHYHSRIYTFSPFHLIGSALLRLYRVTIALLVTCLPRHSLPHLHLSIRSRFFSTTTHTYTHCTRSPSHLPLPPASLLCTCEPPCLFRSSPFPARSIDSLYFSTILSARAREPTSLRTWVSCITLCHTCLFLPTFPLILVLLPGSHLLLYTLLRLRVFILWVIPTLLVFTFCRLWVSTTLSVPVGYRRSAGSVYLPAWDTSTPDFIVLPLTLRWGLLPSAAPVTGFFYHMGYRTHLLLLLPPLL